MKAKIEVDNARKAEIAEANKIIYPKVKLFFDHILTTSHKQHVTPSGIILTDRQSSIKTHQMVVACGENANVKIGDWVEINPARFKVKYKTPSHGVGPDVGEVQVPLEKINEEVYLFMSTRELKWIYDEKPV